MTDLLAKNKAAQHSQRLPNHLITRAHTQTHTSSNLKQKISIVSQFSFGGVILLHLSSTIILSQARTERQFLEL
jgi:hypothetical protein